MNVKHAPEKQTRGRRIRVGNCNDTIDPMNKRFTTTMNFTTITFAVMICPLILKTMSFTMTMRSGLRSSNRYVL